MINYNTVIVFDFETGSKFPETCEVLQLAAVALDPRTLDVKEHFQVYLKPNDWKNVETEALAVNHLTKEFIDEKGVELKLGWNDFVKWVEKFNTKKKFFTAPIPAGHNIINFDLPIIQRLSAQFGQVDSEGRSTLFSSRDRWDLMNLCSTWLESMSEPKKYSLDCLREFFGITKDDGHNAIVDVEHTAAIIARFVKYQRNCAKKAGFKGAFAEK